MRINPNMPTSETLRAIASSSARQAVPALVARTADAVRLSSAGLSLAERTGRDAEAARAIMSHYDLRNISYTDLVAMADALRDAGALKEEDYLDFIGPSPEFAMVTGEPNPEWNALADYVGIHERQLAFLRSSGAERRFVEFAAYQLSLFKYFESLQAG